ncbi:MAG TPA: DUF3828 domain-containing protein [Pyrinomonadaceae bacterium]|jgi:hypothetical protein|nr:DUF3828 domain-containing protein [Pyrinomonadaceae bacterium]
MTKKLLLIASALLFVVSVAQAQASPATPDALVRSLYTAHKNRQLDPFSQTKDRGRLDKYFVKDLADLLWKDAKTSAANNEVGALDGDPLYNAQDMKITAFRINSPQYAEGNRDVADVPVTFKNIGKEETILFRLERNNSKVWKITDIFYKNNPDSASSLRKILTAGQ